MDGWMEVGNKHGLFWSEASLLFQRTDTFFLFFFFFFFLYVACRGDIESLGSAVRTGTYRFVSSRPCVNFSYAFSLAN